MKARTKALVNWFDDRTGYRDIVREALYENIPGGSRWRYVWGSTLVFTFSVQLITGMFLWMCYSPSTQTAWASVHYIQREMQGGAWLRGIHHWTASAMVVLLALHLWQVIVDGAYKAPREVNFWLGLVLMQIVIGLSLTGYLLPWDQKGYWATQVATSIAGLTPIVGDQVQQLAVGGPEYGHHTLTRFFALHAGVLPGLLMVFLALHIYVFRRHGLHYKPPKKYPDGTFWPDQILKDGVACLAVLATVLVLVWYLGAELGAPADPANPYDAARPEWYFLFLFQLLKFFPGKWEVVGAMVIPGLVVGVLFAMPIVGRWKLGHSFNVVFFFSLLAGVGALTYMAVWQDGNNLTYKNGVWEAEQYATLSELRARAGIPPEGPTAMMSDDPKAQALAVATQRCLGCHAYTDAEGHGFRPATPTAPNLYGFGRKEWIAGLLDPDRVAGPHYFGPTEVKEGDMVQFVQGDLKQVDKKDIEKIIAALAAESGLGEESDKPLVREGAELIKTKCNDCHKFHQAGPDLGTAPDLTGYASREWIIGMISDPDHERYYGHLVDSADPAKDRQKMPAYGVPADNPTLTPETIGLLADWLRQQGFLEASELAGDGEKTQKP